MTWNGIHGHDQIAEQFQRSISRGRLASSFLFVGPHGIGKRSFALKLAQALLCENNSAESLTPCFKCPACQQVAALTHPDLIIINKPADKSFIPVELLIGDREHRMREGLCHEMSMKPFRGGRKIAIINDADFLNAEGANCLLKTLEEPPANSILVLIGSSEQKQLPTIRSRCQIIRFQPLSHDDVCLLLNEKNIASDREQANQLAALSNGSVARASEFAEHDLVEFRDKLYSFLSHGYSQSTEFVKFLAAYVEEAGKDAPAKRERMQLVVDLAADFYRAIMKHISGADVDELDAAMRDTIDQASRNWSGDESIAAECLARCLETQYHIAANANQATLLECWLDDLCAIAAPK